MSYLILFFRVQLLLYTTTLVTYITKIVYKIGTSPLYFILLVSLPPPLIEKSSCRQKNTLNTHLKPSRSNLSSHENVFLLLPCYIDACLKLKLGFAPLDSACDSSPYIFRQGEQSACRHLASSKVSVHTFGVSCGDCCTGRRPHDKVNAHTKTDRKYRRPQQKGDNRPNPLRQSYRPMNRLHFRRRSRRR